MKRKRILPTLLVVGLALLITTIQAEPKLELSSKDYDFGFVPQHAKVSHTFMLKSVGDDTLKIVQVVPGCGCTKAPLEKSEIAPGDSATLEIIFNTGRYNGRVKKHPRIVTNEQQNRVNLEFASTVMARPDSTYPIIVKPHKLDFSRLADSAEPEMTFTLHNVYSEPLQVDIVDYPDDLLAITMPTEIPVKGSSDGTVRLIDPNSTAAFEKSITIEVNDLTGSRFTIPVMRSVTADDPTGALENGIDRRNESAGKCRWPMTLYGRSRPHLQLPISSVSFEQYSPANGT